MPREKQQGHIAYISTFFVAPSVSINAPPIAFASFFSHLCSSTLQPSIPRPLSSHSEQGLRLDIAAAQTPPLGRGATQRQSNRREDASRNVLHLMFFIISFRDFLKSFVNLKKTPSPNGVTAPSPVTTTLRIACYGVLFILIINIIGSVIG